MKSLFLFSMLTASTLFGVEDSSTTSDQGLDMHLEADLLFEKKVMVYNYDGLLIKEYALDDVVNDDISLMDHMILEDSDFAFEYFGDFYYLGNSESIQAMAN